MGRTAIGTLLRISCCVVAAGGDAGAGAPDKYSSSWVLLLRQTNPDAGPQGEPLYEKWMRLSPNNPAADQYSIMGNVESCRRGGFFTFKVVWPKGDRKTPGVPKHNIWRQTSNPLAIGPTRGYRGLDVMCPDHDFGGLMYSKTKGLQQALLCNHCDNGNWWHSLGAINGPCGDEFPGGCECTPQAELWVACESRWGSTVLMVVLGGGAMYVCGGLAYARLVNRSPSGRYFLSAHPHWELWQQLYGLVRDGAAFVRGQGGAARIERSTATGRREDGGGVGGGGGKRSSRAGKGKDDKSKSKHGKTRAGKSGRKSASLQGRSVPADRSDDGDGDTMIRERLLQEQLAGSVHSSMQRISVSTKLG
jgi:hypothetical protein